MALIEFINDSAPYLNAQNLNNNFNNLVKFRKFQITFDVSSASVGDFVTGHTTNNIPSESDMTTLGFLINNISSSGDANYVLEPNIRENKIYAKLYVGYRTSAVPSITVTGYIVYADSDIINNTTLI